MEKPVTGVEPVVLAKAKESESYTVQIGSFTTISDAMNQYHAAMMGLMGMNGVTLDYLRVEEIGTFYTVRVGKFMDYMSAQVFLQAARSHLNGAIILKAYIKEERILKRYGEDREEENRDSRGEHLEPAAPAPLQDAPLPHTQEPEQELEVHEKEVVQQAVRNDEETALQLSQKHDQVDTWDFLSAIRGRFYISDYYSADSDDYDFHILTGRVNLYKREEQEAGFYFELDGKVRKEIIKGDLRGNVPRYKVDEAWLGYTFPGQRFRMIAGRQYINELYNTEIDGLNINYSFINGLGIGMFGGLAPDKFDDSVNDDFRSIGAYGFLKVENHNVNLGYEYITYNGEPDREYFSLRQYSRLNKQIRFNTLASISKNQINDTFELETANANLTYSYSKKLRFNVFANYYRTIKYYESSKFYFEFSDTDKNFLLDNNSKTRAGIRIDYKLVKGLKVYGSTAYQHRKMDDEDSTRFTLGLRKYDLYGFDLSGRYTYIDNYSARDNEFYVEIHRNIMKWFDASLYASYEETKLDLENAYTSGSRTYGGTLYWPISKALYLSMFLEYLNDEDYSTTSLFTQLGYKLSP